MTNRDGYLTVQEAADVLDVSRQRVRQLIDKGEFTTKKFRIQYRDITHIPRTEVETRLQEKGS